MTHMYFSARAEGRISYGHLGRTNSCYCCYKPTTINFQRLVLFKIFNVTHVFI